MNDKVAVGELYGGAHLAKQTETKYRRKISGVTELVNGLAGNVLHHEIRQPVVGHPAVQHPCNIGMVEGGERAALRPKVLQRALGKHLALDQLDGHLVAVFAVRPLCKVDRAHPPGGHQAHQFVCPDSPP